MATDEKAPPRTPPRDDAARWLSPAVASALALLFLAQALPLMAGIPMELVVLMGMGIMLGAHLQSQEVRRRLTPRLARICLFAVAVPSVALFAAALLVDREAARPWAWAVAAALAAADVLVFARVIGTRPGRAG